MSDEDTPDRGTWKYCISCSDEFHTPTGLARLCENCRRLSGKGGLTIAQSEEALQEAYQRGVMPQLEADPNDEDFLEIEDDERYSEEDIFEMFGLSDEDDYDEDDF